MNCQGSNNFQQAIYRYVENALIVSSETCKEVLTQLVSTSNKRPSSGEMKIDLKRVGIYTEIDLTLLRSPDEL